MPKPKRSEAEKQLAKDLSKIRVALRRAFMQSPLKREAIRRASEPYTGTQYNIRVGRRCARCQLLYPSTAVVVDHIERCGTLKSYEDLPGLAARMFCRPEGLQVLCVDCDAEKQEEEREWQRKNQPPKQAPPKAARPRKRARPTSKEPNH